MRKKVVVLLCMLLSVLFCMVTNSLAAQKSVRAVTEDGKIVILNPNGTWKYSGSKKAAAADPEDIVKNGALKIDPSVTVGNALNGYKYFGHTTWESFEDSQKRRTVEFVGIFDYDKFSDTKSEELSTVLTADMIRKAKKKAQGLKIAYVAQFSISRDGETFELRYSGFRIFGANQGASKKIRDMEKEQADEKFMMLRNVYANKLEPSVWMFFLILSELKSPEPENDSETEPSAGPHAKNIYKKQWVVSKSLRDGNNVVFFFYPEKCESADGELRQAEIRGSSGEDDMSGTEKLLERGCWKADISSEQIIYVSPNSKLTPSIQGFQGIFDWQELSDLSGAN